MFGPKYERKEARFRTKVLFLTGGQLCMDELWDANSLWEAGRHGYLFSGALKVMENKLYP